MLTSYENRTSIWLYILRSGVHIDKEISSFIPQVTLPSYIIKWRPSLPILVFEVVIIVIIMYQRGMKLAFEVTVKYLETQRSFQKSFMLRLKFFQKLRRLCTVKLSFQSSCTSSKLPQKRSSEIKVENKPRSDLQNHTAHMISLQFFTQMCVLAISCFT